MDKELEGCQYSVCCHNDEYRKMQQENKQLKELCDKYEKEHSTTFQIWLTSIDEYRKQKSLLDKIKEYFNKDVKEELNYLYQKSDDFFKGKDYGDKGYSASIQSVQAISDNILSIIGGDKEW